MLGLILFIIAAWLFFCLVTFSDNPLMAAIFLPLTLPVGMVLIAIESAADWTFDLVMSISSAACQWERRL